MTKPFLFIYLGVWGSRELTIICRKSNASKFNLLLLYFVIESQQDFSESCLNFE